MYDLAVPTPQTLPPAPGAQTLAVPAPVPEGAGFTPPPVSQPAPQVVDPTAYDLAGLGANPYIQATAAPTVVDPTVPPRPAGVPEGFGYKDLAVSGQQDGRLNYYDLKTNQGDNAGRVYAEVGQPVRLVDREGNVIFEGVGPDAAKTIAGMAQAWSDGEGPDKAKKSTWQAQVQTSNGWETSAADAKDNPHKTFWSYLGDYGLPIAASFIPGVGPILGAALGAAANGAVQGYSLKKTLLNSATAAAGSWAGGALNGAIGAAGGAAGNATGQAAGQAAGQTAGQAATQAATQGALQSLPGTVAEVVVNGVSHLVPQAVATGVGTAAGTAAGGALTNSSGNNQISGDAGGDTLQPAAGTTVEEVVVTKAQTLARQGLSIDQMVALGVPASAAAAAFAGVYGGGPQTVTEPMTSQTATSPAGDVQPVTPPDITGLTPTPTGPPPGMNPSIWQKALDLAKGNPMLAASIAATLAGAVAGGGSGAGGKYAVPTVNTTLDPVFSGSLAGKASVDRSRHAVAPHVNYFKYGEGPERMFTSRTPDSNAGWGGDPRNIEVNKRMAATVGYGGEFGDGRWQAWIDAQPESVQARARQILSEAGQGYRATFAKGGHVKGAGTGRSDEIEAMLSDGEYVIDAETVALLGDGSTQAGAAALDKMRVNLRKAKGKALAKGKFSAKAKSPQSYLTVKGI